MARLDGVRALVTGGTSGIGAAVVERLRAEGAAVVLTGRDEGRGQAVAARTGATFVRADVRDPAAVRASVQTATATLGGLDAAVLNAGILHTAPLSETSDDEWDAVMETNLVAPYRYAVACLPALRAAGGGSITLVSSDAGVWPEVAIGAYSVSKRALIWLGQMLACEGGPAGVRANVVCPGDTAPGMATFVDGRTEPGGTSDWLLPPLGRVGTAGDAGAAVAFYVSADSAFCSGSVLLVDGGMRASLQATEVANA
ncbi:MAG: SDR family oxidoreductase [Actinomycetota bacterium]|nr:SDR family oxidoreductase [Actinomycetota bacterium]